MTVSFSWPRFSIMTEWRFYAATGERGPAMRCVDGKLEPFPLVIGTARVWEQAWGPTLGTVKVTDPHYHRPHRAGIHEIRGDDGSTVRFAVTEFSNGIYGFYTSDKAPQTFSYVWGNEVPQTHTTSQTAISSASWKAAAAF